MLIHIWQITVNGRKTNFATEAADMAEAIQLFKNKFQKENPDKAFNADKIQCMDSVRLLVEDFKKNGVIIKVNHTKNDNREDSWYKDLIHEETLHEETFPLRKSK